MKRILYLIGLCAAVAAGCATQSPADIAAKNVAVTFRQGTAEVGPFQEPGIYRVSVFSKGTIVATPVRQLQGPDPKTATFSLLVGADSVEVAFMADHTTGMASHSVP